MKIAACCEACFFTFDAPATAAGRRVKCPECGAAVRIPKIDPSNVAPLPMAPRVVKNASRKKPRNASSSKQSSRMDGIIAKLGEALSGGLLFKGLLGLAAVAVVGWGGSYRSTPSRTPARHSRSSKGNMEKLVRPPNGSI